METLTRDLIEDHLFSCVELMSEKQGDGAVRWAWTLTDMAYQGQALIHQRECSFEFSSRDAAMRFAFGWIKRNRPDLEAAAVREAKEGIRYRAVRASKSGA